ncbi:MAG: hypothetical protein L3K11_05495, partial [Thermoplasmata archaeon]|nr:hypothetical protein [Thermoplasmata archaeon]
ALDEGLIAEAVHFQELLHATLGYDRRLASLGLYPGGSLRFPLRYDLESMAGLEFTPLGQDRPVPVEQFYAEHPMAQRYGAMGRQGDACLTLRDAHGTVLSLPPVLNSGAVGEIRAGDRRLLLEATGTRRARVEEAIALLALPFLLRGWSAAPVRVKAPDGVRSGEALLAPRRVELPAALIARLSGIDLPPEEVEGLLGRARFAFRRGAEEWLVAAPPWRNDLLGPVDVVEDLLLLRGVRIDEGYYPPSPTVGRRRPESRWRRQVGGWLLGLGFTPVHNSLLLPADHMARLGRTEAIDVANPTSAELSRLRDALQASLLASLGRNLRHGYPQRLSELGPVLRRDPEAESGARTESHLGFVLAGEGVGFSDAASLLEYLLRRCTVQGVREPATLPATIPGRAARLRIAGEVVGELGEIHPAVLEFLGLPVPVAWGELDLHALYPLLGGPTDSAPAEPRATAAPPGDGPTTEI